MNRFIIIILLFCIIFTGCQKNESSINDKNDIQKEIMIHISGAENFEEFRNSMLNNNFTEKYSDFHSISDGLKLNISRFEQNDYYYIHIYFLCEDENQYRSIFLELDNLETTKPNVIHSENLRILSECYLSSIRTSPIGSKFEFRPSLEGINKQWFGFYLKAKDREDDHKDRYKNIETIQGEILIQVEDEFWSGVY